VENPAWPTVKRWLLIAAEASLVVAILALVVLTWLPALIGPHPGLRAPF
jgi:hypothetical protein